MNKILILDPCYHKMGGHHHDVNRHLIQHFERFKLAIMADKELYKSGAIEEFNVQQIEIIAADNIGYLSDEEYGCIGSFYELAKNFALQLKKLDCNVIVAHTLMHFHLMGLGMRLHRSAPHRLIISQMFSPFEGLRSTPNNRLDYYLTMQALNCLNHACINRSHRITIGISSEYHWELYKDAIDRYTLLDFRKCPWLVGCHNHGYMSVDEKSLNTPKGTKKEVILYLGDAKEDKGIFLVKDFLRYLDNKSTLFKTELASKIKIYLSVGSADEWLAPVVDEIEVICKANRDLVTFDRHRLSPESLKAVLTSSNLIIWLYDPIKYQYRSSGIFFEALSAMYHCQQNPFLVVSKGSWIEQECQYLDINHITIDISQPDWMQSVVELMASHPTSSSNNPFNLQTAEQYVEQSFASWVNQQLDDKLDFTVQYATTAFDNISTLIISTKYPHFSSLSGPAGFAAYLNHSVQIKSALGRTSGYDYLRAFVGLKTASDSALCQEIDLLKHNGALPHSIICVDGEHCGALLGRAIQSGRLRESSNIFAWYHQPRSILREQIIDSTSFPVQGLNPICISPCQVEFFENDLGYKKDAIHVIPHGIHKHLLNIGKLSFHSKTTTVNSILPGSIRFLTVGAWQRDSKLLLDIARSFPQHHFTWISSGLKLEHNELQEAIMITNLQIVAHGISNHELYKAYHHSDILFQPLIAATANNAILEAMAHGLPIVTKDLVSTRWYLGDNGYFYRDEKECWNHINSLSNFNISTLRQIGAGYIERAQSYEWSRIAAMFESLLNGDS